MTIQPMLVRGDSLSPDTCCSGLVAMKQTNRLAFRTRMKNPQRPPARERQGFVAFEENVVEVGDPQKTDMD